jgi:hypothetical protein
MEKIEVRQEEMSNRLSDMNVHLIRLDQRIDAVRGRKFFILETGVVDFYGGKFL